MKFRYTLIVDSSVVWESDSVRRCKEKAEFYFDHLNAFDARIMRGNKLYSYRMYDTKWTR